MKFTLVAVLLCCIFAATTASLVLDDLDRDFIIDHVQNLNELENEDISIWNPIPWIKHLFSATYQALKLLVRSAKGVLCAFAGVKDVAEVAVAFPIRVAGCGVGMPKSLVTVAKDLQVLMKQSRILMNYQETICTGVAARVPKVCQAKLLPRLYALYEQVQKTVADAQDFKASPGVAGQCLKSVVNNMVSELISYPKNIISCSVL